MLFVASLLHFFFCACKVKSKGTCSNWKIEEREFKLLFTFLIKRRERKKTKEKNLMTAIVFYGTLSSVIVLEAHTHLCVVAAAAVSVRSSR